MEVDLLKKFLGKPLKVNYDNTQAKFNCPRCKEENGFKFDDKYNLEINLNNKKKRFKFKKIFHCWSCSFSGPIQLLFREYAPTHINNDYKSLEYDNPFVSGYVDESQNEITKEEKIVLPKEFVLFKDMDHNNQRHLEALNYVLNERKLKMEQLIFYKVGFCTYGLYYKRIIIPSYDKKLKLNYFVTRTYDPTIKQKYQNSENDKTKVIFNEYLVNWNETIYLVEGLFDYFALPINTIPLLGKELNTSFHLFSMLIKYKPNVILCLDDDAIKKTKEIIKLLTFYGLKVKSLKICNKDLAKNFEMNGKNSIFTLLCDK